MKQLTTFTNLQELKDGLINKMNDHSIELVEELPSGYICDAFREYADYNTSIYYCDQRQFYLDHTEECENALYEYGYTGEILADLLKECGDLDGLICKAGAIGEYSAIYNELAEDENEIKQLYVINELIRKGRTNIDADILSDIFNDLDSCDTFDQIDDTINEAIEESEQQKEGD